MTERFDVLVVEPDALQRQLVDLLLSDPRMRIVEAVTARDALEHLRSATPDLIIAAADLPDLDGFALATRLKRVARLAAVPIIVTAEPDAGSGLSRDMRTRSEEAGVDLLLPRPLGDKNLKERTLRLILNRPPARQPAQARDLRSTVALDEVLENLRNLEAQGGAYSGGSGGHGTAVAGEAAPAAGASAPARARGDAPTPQAIGHLERAKLASLERAKLASLERENLALRRENDELRASVERLKRKLNDSLPGGRNKRS